MAMQKREKVLAGVVGGMFVVLVGAFFLGGSGVSTSDLQNQRNKLASDLQKYKAQITRTNRLKVQLDDWQKRSLPDDRALAQSLYQNWLLEIMDKNHLHHIDVKPGDVQAHKNIYDLFPFTARFQGTQEQLVRFLHTFYSSSNLDQIKRISIKPTESDKSTKSSASSSSAQLEVTLSIEAMSIAGISRHDALSKAPTKRLAQPNVTEYVQMIGQRKIFAPYSPIIIHHDDSGNKLDIAKYVYLTAITEADGRLQAWFSVRPTDKNYILYTGEKFKTGDTANDYEATVVRISQREADLEISGTVYRMTLGSNLYDAQPLSTTSQSGSATGVKSAIQAKADAAAKPEAKASKTDSESDNSSDEAKPSSKKPTGKYSKYSRRRPRGQAPGSRPDSPE